MYLPDIITLLVLPMILVAIVVLIVLTFRTLLKRSKQMDRIEKKLDEAVKQVKGSNK